MTTMATREQGVDVYEEACARCHRLGDLGEDYGPDLTTIGNRFTRRDMLEAVLWPSREISDQYGSWRIETENDVYSAMILEEDEASVTILIPDLDRPVTIQREDIVDLRESDVSIMPEGLLDEFQMRQTGGTVPAAPRNRVRRERGTETPLGGRSLGRLCGDSPLRRFLAG